MRSSKKSRNRGKPYHHGNLRPALVEAAARLAAKDGVEKVSLRRVAALARVSPAAPYHHFKNKADLLAAVAEEGFRRLNLAMERAHKRHITEPVHERFRRMGVEYVRFAVRNPHYFRVMFRPEIAHAAVRNPDSHGERAFMSLVRTVQAVRGESGEPSRDTMDRVLFAWSTVHGLASLWIDGSLRENEFYKTFGINALADAVTSVAVPAMAPAP